MSKPQAPSFSELQKEHQALLESLEKEPSILIEGSPARKEWLQEAESFLDRFRACVGKARKRGAPAELEWLARAASQWQRAMSGRLNLPRDIRQEIGLEPEAAWQAEASILVTPKATWNRARIEERLNCESFFIGANRKILAVLRRFRQLQRMQAQRIHAEIPSNQQELWQDWYDACRFLTLDVLLGRVDFARLIDPSAYEFLDTVWLDDVKQLLAYLLWEQSNSEPGFQAEADFYYPACEQIEQRLFSQKAEVTFDAVAGWWKERYVTGTKPTALTDIICRKAQRIWEKTGRRDEQANWAAAKKYVDDFYFQLLPAVLEKDRAAIKTIYQALRSFGDPEGGCDLVSGLEAAIAGSFIDFSCLQPKSAAPRAHGAAASTHPPHRFS
jgi:hypothetical protein